MCIATIHVQAQDSLKLPSKTHDELNEISSKSNGWKITYGTDGREKVKENILKDGQIVNFCKDKESDEGLLHQHHPFVLQGDEFILMPFRESYVHGGEIIRQCEVEQIFNDSGCVDVVARIELLQWLLK